MQARASPTMSTSVILLLTFLSLFSLVDAHSSNLANTNRLHAKLRMERRQKSSCVRRNETSAVSISTPKSSSGVSGTTLVDAEVTSLGKKGRVAVKQAGTFVPQSLKKSSNSNGGQCTISVSSKVSVLSLLHDKRGNGSGWSCDFPQHGNYVIG
ncbi:hypothetical protein BT69DRAFT_127915 [Atractiella rhizophila]|nr:hypothetical protein BT69DRAFT_1059196 [Atractiella rhizophila]KAH8929696.1 hypothetical protein BT69DRAFT_127915 [Atractiella rhizophila]